MNVNNKICSNIVFIKIKICFEIITAKYKDILKIVCTNNSYKNKNKSNFFNFIPILKSIIIQPCNINIIKEYNSHLKKDLIKKIKIFTNNIKNRITLK